MSLGFDQPWWLVLPVAAAVLALFMMRAARGRSRWWRGICVVLPMAAGVLLGVGLAGPAWVVSTTRARHVVVLVDFSASTRQQAFREPRWLQRQLSRQLPAGVGTVSVVGFAEGPQVLAENLPVGDVTRWPMAWPAREGAGGGGTDVGAALAWRSAEEVATGNLAPRLMYADGLFDGRGLGELPFALHVVGAEARAVDVGVRSIAFTQKPLQLVAMLAATGEANTTVVIQQNGREIARRPVRFAGRGERLVTIPFEKAPEQPGVLAVEVLSADPWPENNRASLTLAAATPTKVLVVGETLGAYEHVSAEKFSVEQAAGYGAVVVNDLPFGPGGGPGVLSPQVVAGLENLARELGTGVLFYGPTRGFGPGRYHEHAALERFSPLASLPPERPPVRITFLLDASASMNQAASDARADRRFSLVIAGVLEALTLLKPDDQIDVLAFNTSTTSVVSGTLKEIGPKLRETLAGVQPNGTTTPDSALPLLREKLAAEGVLILLTDGEVPQVDVGAWSVLLGKNKTLFTIVSPPPTGGGAKDQLAKLAEATGALTLNFEQADQWPALLRRAVADRLAGRARTDVLRYTMGDVSATTNRWVEAFAKPDAPVRIRAERFALAAVAQRGLGKVAGLTVADDLPRSELLREISAPPSDPRFGLNVERRGDAFVLTVDARGGEGDTFINGAALTARTLTTSASFVQIGPGQYEATLPRGGVGGQVGVVASERGVVARFNVPDVVTEELPASVSRVAPINGAVMLDAGESYTPRAMLRRTPLQRLCFASAAILLLAALFLKRQPFASGAIRG